ncbi:MAG: VOC family protein [Hyphomicrobiales bacterium]|nr:VOC family protein [Hyphomicrobiales bacterium]
MNLPKDTAVWFEIPVSNLTNAREFYQNVLQVTMIEQEMGSGTVMIFPVEDMQTGVSGNLYEGKPGNNNGPTIHLSAPTPLEDTLERVVAAGGEIISEEVIIPGGRFVYCKDHDGNSIGLFNRN